MSKKIECSIEHHAILFALMSKYVITTCGERGKQAILNGITLYGSERGARMAKRAIENGDALDLVTSQAYGEWKAEPYQMEKSVIQTEPTLVTATTKCPWCTYWNKHGLLDYGKYYCVTIDEAVFNGFCKDYHVDVVKTLSWGEDCCEFDWKSPMTQQDTERLLNKKEKLADTCIKDFNYHTAHLFYTVSRILKQELGNDGKQAVEHAKREFIEIFGELYFEAFQNVYTDIYI